MPQNERQQADKQLLGLHDSVQRLRKRAVKTFDSLRRVGEDEAAMKLRTDVRNPLISDSSKIGEQLGQNMKLTDFEVSVTGLFFGRRLYTNHMLDAIRAKAATLPPAYRGEAQLAINEQREEERRNTTNGLNDLKAQYEGLFTDEEMDRYFNTIRDAGFILADLLSGKQLGLLDLKTAMAHRSRQIADERILGNIEGLPTEFTSPSGEKRILWPAGIIHDVIKHSVSKADSPKEADEAVWQSLQAVKRGFALQEIVTIEIKPGEVEGLPEGVRMMRVGAGEITPEEREQMIEEAKQAYVRSKQRQTEMQRGRQNKNKRRK